MKRKAIVELGKIALVILSVFLIQACNITKDKKDTNTVNNITIGKNIVDTLMDKDRSKFIDDLKNIEKNSSDNKKLNTNLSKDEMTLLMINSVRI